MVFIPIKLIPYLLIAAGLFSLFDGEVGTGLTCIGIGGIWLFIKHQLNNRNR